MGKAPHPLLFSRTTFVHVQLIKEKTQWHTMAFDSEIYKSKKSCQIKIIGKWIQTYSMYHSKIFFWPCQKLVILKLRDAKFLVHPNSHRQNHLGTLGEYTIWMFHNITKVHTYMVRLIWWWALGTHFCIRLATVSLMSSIYYQWCLIWCRLFIYFFQTRWIHTL